MMRKNNKFGFTVIELLISISIFTMMLVVIVSGYFAIVRSIKNTEIKNEILIDVQKAFDLIQNEWKFGTFIKGHIGDFVFIKQNECISIKFENNNIIFLEGEPEYIDGDFNKCNPDDNRFDGYIPLLPESDNYTIENFEIKKLTKDGNDLKGVMIKMQVKETSVVGNEYYFQTFINTRTYD